MIAVKVLGVGQVEHGSEVTLRLVFPGKQLDQDALTRVLSDLTYRVGSIGRRKKRTVVERTRPRAPMSGAVRRHGPFDRAVLREAQRQFETTHDTLIDIAKRLGITNYDRLLELQKCYSWQRKAA